ncbi:alpha-glucosidase/alpha-galactosidase [Breznakiella homolactica]|uniref:Alpha-glucosidase/alpha-galactosidase n=1 Tax=Breznakiella homolactica TaxID=2798577 RepID=A0A7T7XMX9_9SPIR|nr:alpha-glucosidase/alpha-galactosidase [Breznakiella homolactica]QQO09178.1 alpha-glucosidase/alpha-galactosidase [Breznakiella homolactica]
MKIAFMGAGSTVFAKNVLGDIMCAGELGNADIRLYDIDAQRLDESKVMLDLINRNCNAGRAAISVFMGTENRRKALDKADFVVNAIQVGGYDPATIADFEIPKKYGLRQTIGDTLGIGGIMRGLRTIPVLEDFARDMEEVCPDTWFLNYTNPMAILTGYMQRYTGIKTVGLCHSVQVCSERLLRHLGMEDVIDGRRELIAGINHMAWLLKILDRDGRDLYPEIRRRAAEQNAAGLHNDMVRYEYLRRFGYYCTESSEHNAEYNPFFIKARYPELIERFNIPLDEYPRRCVQQIEEWKSRSAEFTADPAVSHERSREYASYIIESIILNKPYEIGGNILNAGLIGNLPADACVEVPCLVNGEGIRGCRVGSLPVQLAAMNMTNINVQLLTIAAARERKKDLVYNAAMLDPHTAAELDIDSITAMCDELMEAHAQWLPEYK